MLSLVTGCGLRDGEILKESEGWYNPHSLIYDV